MCVSMHVLYVVCRDSTSIICTGDHLPYTKSGDSRTAPLSLRTIEVLKNLPFSEMADGAKGKTRSGQVFPITAMTLGKGFAQALVRARQKYIQDAQWLSLSL